MRIVVLGGAGLMGRVAVRDLCESPLVEQVVLADLDLEAGRRVAQAIASDRLLVIPADASDEQGLAQALCGAAVCLNASNYYFNLSVMRACLAAGCHYLDLGGLFHTTRRQLELDAAFRDAGLTALLGMGSAPGVTNLEARIACDRLDRVEYIRIYCGGYVPEISADDPLTWGYSIQTILDEVSQNPMIFREGRFQEVPPLSELEHYAYRRPLGYVANHHSLHSEVATLPLSFADKGVREVLFKINFFGYPEPMLRRVAFLCELGLAETEPVEVKGVRVRPRDLLLALLRRRQVPPEEVAGYEDLVAEVRGSRDGVPVTVRVDVEGFPKPEWGVAGGALVTGVAPSLAAQWLADGRISMRGALPPEIAVPAEPFLTALGRHGITTTISETTPLA